MVSLSTTKAKFIVCIEVVKEELWLRGFTKKLGIVHGDVIDTIYCDNKYSIHLSKHRMFLSKSKHVVVKFHLIRSILIKGMIKLDKVYT